MIVKRRVEEQASERGNRRGLVDGGEARLLRNSGGV